MKMLEDIAVDELLSVRDIYSERETFSPSAKVFELTKSGLNRKRHVKIATEKVLIVEDNCDNAEIIQKLLESEGITSEIAKNGTEALEYCEEVIPSLILMDIGLPDIDGFELTRKLREDERFDQTPILAVTAHSLPLMKQQAVEAGCNDFIAKPLMPNDVMQHTIISHLATC